jgi:hypothetical protein
VPHRGASWGPKLAAAGFTVEGEGAITVHIDGSHNKAVGHYALSSLRRLRGGAAQALFADDLAAFDQLLDTDSPHSILRRSDLAVRTERTVWPQDATELRGATAFARCNAGNCPCSARELCATPKPARAFSLSLPLCPEPHRAGTVSQKGWLPSWQSCCRHICLMRNKQCL